MNDLDSSAKLDADKSTFVLLGFASVIGLSLADVVPIIKGWRDFYYCWWHLV